MPSHLPACYNLNVMIRLIRILLLPLYLACLSATQPLLAQSTIPQSLNLEYSFSLASMTLGAIEKRLTFSDGIYTADSKIKPGRASKMLYKGEVTEISTFRVDSDDLVPLSFHAVRKKHKPYDRKAVFDHEAKLVRYNSDKTEPLRENTVDIGSFPFAFMLEDLAQIEGKVYQINNGKGYSTHVVLKPSKETVTTPAGEFSTTKITLQNSDKPERSYHVWLADESHYPVQIIGERDNKSSTLSLVSVTE